MGPGPQKSPPTTAEKIADALRSAILNGTLQSGQPLRQDDIARDFDVSKIPVREALSRLEVEGLVTIRRNRGAVVTHLSFREVDEIYAMRIALETLALRRAIPAQTSADLAAAERILADIDIEKNLKRWAELNWNFHAALYRPSCMNILLKTVEGLHTNVARFLQVSQLGDLDYLAKSQNEHYRLLDSCRRKDVEEACVQLQRHLSGPVTHLAELMPITDWT